MGAKTNFLAFLPVSRIRIGAGAAVFLLWSLSGIISHYQILSVFKGLIIVIPPMKRSLRAITVPIGMTS